MVGRKEASKIEKYSRNSLQRSKSSSTKKIFLRFFCLAFRISRFSKQNGKSWISVRLFFFCFTADFSTKIRSSCACAQLQELKLQARESGQDFLSFLFPAGHITYDGSWQASEDSSNCGDLHSILLCLKDHAVVSSVGVHLVVESDASYFSKAGARDVLSRINGAFNKVIHRGLQVYFKRPIETRRWHRIFHNLWIYVEAPIYENPTFFFLVTKSFLFFVNRILYMLWSLLMESI